MLGALFLGSALAAWNLRRYTRGAHDRDTFVALLAANALPLAVGLTTVSGVFLLAEWLIDPNNAADLSAALWAEQQIAWLQSKAALFRIPWGASFIVLFVVFVASLPSALAERGMLLARLAARVAAVLRRYSKIVTTVNLLLTIACSFTLFDASLQRDGDRLRAHMNWARQEMNDVAALTRAIADVEIKTAVLARTIDAAPPDVRGAAEERQRLDDASDRLGGDIQAAISAGIPLGDIPGVTKGERPHVYELDAATPPWTLDANPPVSQHLRDRTFAELFSMDNVLRAYISTDRFAQKLQLVAEMKSRKALTASAVKHVVHATFEPLVDAVAVLPFGRLVADVAVSAAADLTNTRAEARLASAIETYVERTGTAVLRPLAEKAAEEIVVDQSAVIDAHWATTLNASATELHVSQARAIEQRRSIEATRAAVQHTLAEHHVTFEPPERRTPPEDIVSDADLDRPRLASVETKPFDAFGFHLPPAIAPPEEIRDRPLVTGAGRPIGEPIDARPVEVR